MSQAIVDVISDIRGHYDVPDGDQAPGVDDTGGYRAGLKSKAANISRTQYEVYSFSIAWVLVLLEWYRLYR